MIDAAADATARLAALDTRHSILLQAPAGSGKTTVLVCRYLRLLAEVDAPEAVLAITFTRKAAAEMRGRVLEGLALAAAGAAPRNDGERVVLEAAALALRRSRDCGWQLEHNPARLRIQTIDAANLAIVAQSPVQAGSSTRARMAAQPEDLYRRAAAQTLQAAVDEPELQPHLRDWLHRMDNEWPRLEGLLAGMLPVRAGWLPVLQQADSGELAALVSASLARLTQQTLAGLQALVPPEVLAEGCAVAEAVTALGVKSTAEAGAWRAAPATPLGSDAGELLRWRWLGELLLIKGPPPDWRKQLTVANGIPKEQKALKQRAMGWIEAMGRVDGARDAWTQLLQLPPLPLPESERAALLSLSALLRRAVAELRLVFAADGSVDFAQVASAARQALVAGNAPTERALQRSVQLQHLLIDEFQDTSLEQLRFLEALTAAWSPGDGHTVFMVGDPMQSIYQFRHAEVGNFLQVREHGLGALPVDSLQLGRNFRSHAPLVEWVNQCCARLFPSRDDIRLGAIRFLPAVAHRAAPAQVELHASAGPADAAARQREAAAVLAIVRAARARAPEASIAVLVAARSHAVQISAALQAARIPVRGIKIDALGDRALVSDLLALARALQHPADRIAWLALLRSPACGLELSELQLFAGEAAPAVWPQLERILERGLLQGEPALRLRRLYSALQPAMAGGERHERLATRVHRCWLRLGGTALCRDRRDLADARACLAALEARSDAELLTAAELDALTDDLYAAPADDPLAIDVLTLHGAKGLEWDVVIAPGLGRERRNTDRPLLEMLQLPALDAGDDPEVLLAPLAELAGTGEHQLGRYIRGLRQQRLALERVRLLYVLLTRARSALHLFGHCEPTAGGGWAPAARSLLKDLWPAVGGDFVAQLQAVATAGAAAGASAPVPAAGPEPVAGVRRQRLPASWRLSPPEFAVEQLPLPPPQPAERVEYRWVGQTARALGTVVHAELQRLAGQHWAGALTADEYAGWLAELGVPADERAGAAAEVLQALAQVQSDERGRWLFEGGRHRAAASEVRLSGLHHGELVNISIDRLLVDASGTRWVVDFKTNRHEGGDLGAFIAREVQRYRPQLARYAELAARLGPEPVRCALYFPLLGEFCEVAI